jgi:trk system potassium uptake protein TrkH
VLDLRPVFLIIGALLSVLASAMTLPALVDLASDNGDWQVFAAAGITTLFVGVSLVLMNRSGGTRLNLRQAFLLTTLSWTIVVAFAALPFTFASLDLSYADAYFEAMSGLTTTGATVIVGLDHAPPGILLWRGLLNWMGGIGIIAMAVAILPALRVGGMQLFRLESSDKSEKVLPRATQIAGGIAMIYLTISVVCAALYWIGGMTALEASANAMATVSTAGFSTADASFAKFDSAFIEFVGIVFMLLGGMTFTLFLRVLQGDWTAPLRDSQTRWYLGIFASFTAAIGLWHWLMNDATFWFSLRHSAFNVASVLTTTGFASTDFSAWGPLPVVLIFFLLFIGGCSGSTSGAIKVFRFQILFEIGRTHVRHAVAPSGVFVPKYNRRPITESVTQSVLSFVVLYIFTWAAISAALAICGLDPITSLSGAAAALGNVGPGLGDVIGMAGNYSTLPDAAKWVLSLAMLLGRLELVTVLVIMSRSFWRS